MFPIWLGMIHFLSQRSLQNGVTADKLSNAFQVKWRSHLQSKSVGDASLINTVFYFASVLVTLAFTELGKASFATTRPASPVKAINDQNAKSTKWIRRYGPLVQSLKSKHSFPSGDSAQAMNLCMFLFRYVPVQSSIRDMVLLGLFVPGVAFARVFYWCHWIEDTMGGVALAFLLHGLLVPLIGEKIMDVTSV
jgi:membrane-associated phospholipid phosphatase